ISNINWIHPETKETLQETTYTENVALTAQIENQESSSAKITITKEDGTEFENGQTELAFEEEINEDGTIELSALEIKQQWEEFKTADIDKLVAKIDHNGYQKKSSVLQVIPPPKVIVDFRPSKSYDGEYGFDYMRDKNKKDKLTYKDILGTNKTVISTTTKKKENKFTKYTTDAKYKELKCDFYDSIDIDWHKNPDGSHYEYIQSWLSIYPKETQTLSLQVETIENPKKLDLTFEYNKTLFKLNTEKIPAQSKGKKRLKDHLTIECIKEFNTDQIIKVLYGKRQLGQLNVLKNDKANRKKVEVVFVKVNTQLFSGTVKKGKTTGEDAFLKKYLTQAYIQPNIIEEVLDLTADTTFNKTFDTKSKGYIDNRTGLHDYLNKKMDTKYKDYLKVYFIPDECPSFNKAGTKVGRVNGQAKDISSDAVVLFDGHNTSTTTHESLHALGLYHTFSRDKNHPYSYKKGETYNIMDYSHQSRYGSKKRIMTWLWQWKKLWTNTLIKSE
ncbi:zinc metalloprotease, partial [Bizionia paragorgiae]